MNGIERITERITADAERQARERLDAAQAEADRTVQTFRTQAEAEAKELAGRSARAAAEREERLVSTAQMEARKTILAAKQEMVERAYALALEKLCHMPEESRMEALAGLLREASSTGREEVIFSPEDRKTVGKRAVEKANALAGTHMTLSAQTAPIRGGFILKDRNVEVNCTFETLVRLEKSRTSGAVVRQLFPPDAPEPSAAR